MTINYYKPGVWNAICSVCLEQKDLSAFYLHSNGKPRKQCKSCHLKRSSLWAKKHKQVINKLSQIRLQNPEKRQAALDATKKWRLSNKPYDAMRARERRARQLQAMPLWVDRNEILEIYKKCPKDYHVDHIIPLKHDLVSGLHVPWNLQYLPAIENIRKKNYVIL